MAPNLAIEWLLEPTDVGVRYLAMRDLVRVDKKELAKAREQAHAEGPIARVLAKMKPEGYWERPGSGYGPKYRGTVWSLMLLAQLGASVECDERIGRACAYELDHALAEHGGFSYNGTPSGTIDCLQGNLCAAMLDLGYQDERLDRAFEWIARTVTGEGLAPVGDKTTPLRYYAYKCGPSFACGANDKQPCAWGGVKIMLALSKLPKKKRTGLIARAIEAGAEYLLRTDPATANYPTPRGNAPNRSWWKFGFPVFYVTDVLQNVEALAGVGYGKDPRLAPAIALIRDKQDDQGRWPLEYDYTGKTWIDVGDKRKPSKWVTWRALRVLKASNALTRT